MGAYLSEPVTEKISTDDQSERVRYGASSMQGWRVSQEDAHNCIIEFDKNASLFAVYDGHGGHEIAVYCSQKLPDFIKETEAYKKGDFKTALIDAFLGFDATIATREVVSVLKEIAGVKDNDGEDFGLDDEEENVKNLYEEASMPIEQVMEKYQANLLNPHLKKIQGDKVPASPLLKARKQSGESSGSSTAAASSSKVDPEESSVSKKDTGIDATVISSASSDVSCSDSMSTSLSNGETKTDTSSSDAKEVKVLEKKPVKDETETKDEKTADIKDEKKVETKDETESEEKKSVTNGETKESSSPQANGEVTSSPKGKGKAIVKKTPKTDPPVNVKNLRTRSARQLYHKLWQMEEESDTEDENDTTFEGIPSSYSSSEESSEGADDEGDDDDEDEVEEGTKPEEKDYQEEEEEEEEDIYGDDNNEFTRTMVEEPGSDSGCTAVVALLYGNELYVANAGDSRCIVCRKGKAIEMSFDHKPEDEPEMDRVMNAGGEVTQDGRVNGGLNLSRAIGDHAYKQNKKLSDREQMITALPDVKTLTIDPSEDEFMVLACDGIWNFMSSQEVVDFVRPRLNKTGTNPEKLSQICEEMFDHCLAPHTMGDGTGCDNMTAVIVQFKNNSLKRSSSVDEDCEGNCPKKAKTEESTD